MRLGDLDKLKENFIKWLPKEGEDFLSNIHPIENIVISAIMEIEEAPTINPEDLRPKGRWEFGVKHGASGYWCSNCESGFTGENAEWIAKEHDYCPKCGADNRQTAILL